MFPALIYCKPPPGKWSASDLIGNKKNSTKSSWFVSGIRWNAICKKQWKRVDLRLAGATTHAYTNWCHPQETFVRGANIFQWIRTTKQFILSAAAFRLTWPLVFFFQYKTFCTASLPNHIRSCTADLNKWVQGKKKSFRPPPPKKKKVSLFLNNFLCDPPRLRTLGTSSCTDCHCCARVAGPDHRLVEAADAGVLSLHGGPKRPRQCESETYRTSASTCTGTTLLIN